MIMSYKGFTVLLLILATFCNLGGSQMEENITDLELLQPLQEKILERLSVPEDGPFELKIKKLIAEYLVASTLESVSNTSVIDDESRAVPEASPQQQQQPQIIYVYVTPPPANAPTQRTRRTRPTRTPRPPRTRRPGHNSRESTTVAAPQPQIIYVPVPVPANQLQLQQQQQPAFQPPLQQPQDSVVAGPPQTGIMQQLNQPVQTSGAATVSLQNATYPPTSQQSNTNNQTAQPPQIQIVYLPATTPASQTTRPTGPTTTPRPRPSPEHVYNQVHKILDNVAWGNITGIVDQALGIRTPMPTRNFVNGILNTVFCNPINRLLGRCRGNA